MGTTNLFRPYCYGSRRLDDYAIDIKDAINANTASQSANSAHLERMVSKQILAAGQMHEDMSAVRDDLQVLQQEVCFGFDLVVDRLDLQIEMFSIALQKLEEIRRMLRSPRATEAAELFREGEYCFQNRFNQEALEAFLKSEQISKVNYLLQFRIGSLLCDLAGAGSGLDTWSSAEGHLLLAARYAEAEIEKNEVARRYAARSYFRAAKVSHRIGGYRYSEDDHAGMRTCLEHAVDSLDRASKLWPKYTPTIYYEAKCRVLLGEGREALEKLRILSDRDRSYLGIAICDGDFESIRREAEELLQQAIETPGPLARATQHILERVTEEVSWLNRSSLGTTAPAVSFPTLEHRLSRAKQLLKSPDLNVETLHIEVTKLQQDLNREVEEALKTRARSQEAQRQVLETEKNTAAATAEGLKAQVRGKAFGLGYLSLVIFVCCTLAFESMLGININDPITLLLDLVGSGVMAFPVGQIVFRGAIRRRPQIAANMRRAEELNRVLAQLNERIKMLSRETREFSFWQASTQHR